MFLAFIEVRENAIQRPNRTYISEDTRKIDDCMDVIG